MVDRFAGSRQVNEDSTGDQALLITIFIDHLLDQMVAKKHFIFSTDSYHSGSIKAQERLRRGSSDRIILSGPATRKPFDFKIFLANDDNKKQLCQLLLRVWGDRVAASRLQRNEMAILIVEGKAYQLIASNGEVSRQPSFII